VRANGTLVLVGESFQFRSLVLNSGAKLILRRPLAPTTTAVTVSVASQFLVDGAVISSAMNAGSAVGQSVDARAVLWKYHGTTELHLTVHSLPRHTAAPNCKARRVQRGFQGSLWGEGLEIPV
jgi:hypothetical protein